MARTRFGWLARLTAWAIAGALAACGGGGGGNDEPTLEAPPASAATLQATSGEASGGTAATVDGAQSLVELSASLNTTPLGGTGSLSSSLELGRRALQSTRERALEAQTLTCAQFLGTSSCSGSVRIDTNASGSSSTVPAGTYIEMTFNDLEGTAEGSPVRLDGTLRLDFLTSFDTNAMSFAGLRFRLALSGFSGLSEGVSFGPISRVALFEFDGQGVASITADGWRVSGLDSLIVSDENSYTLGDVTVRRAHWASANGYVDVHYEGWSVVAGRPTVNSTATLTAGSNSLVVQVTSSTSQTVVYAITLTVGGVTSAYTVTAAYPAGGGAPTYTVVPATT